MADRTVDADRFASAIEDILDGLHVGVLKRTPRAIKKGLQSGAKEWRANAKAMFGGSGAYAGSIRSRMSREGGDKPAGEIGSPTYPGLPHLLEKGHATIGGGRVPGREHIAPAADTAFLVTMEEFDRLIEEAIRDA